MLSRPFACAFGKHSWEYAGLDPFLRKGIPVSRPKSEHVTSVVSPGSIFKPSLPFPNLIYLMYPFIDFKESICARKNISTIILNQCKWSHFISGTSDYIPVGQLSAEWIYAGYGIRTRELLRDRILSPAPLASLANPALISSTCATCIVFYPIPGWLGHLACILLE